MGQMCLVILSGRKCPRMFGNKIGVFKSPSMFQAVLGNAEVAQRVLEGWFKGLEGFERVLKGCFNVLTWCLKVKVFKGRANVFTWC